MEGWLAFVVLCLIQDSRVQAEEFLPSLDEKSDIKPNSRIISHQPVGYNDVVNNDDITDDMTLLPDMVHISRNGDATQSRQDIDVSGGSLRNQGLLNAGVQDSSNDGDDGKKLDQSVNLIDILKSQPVGSDDTNPNPLFQSARVQNTNFGRSRSSNVRNGQRMSSVPRETMKNRSVKPSTAANSRCPECKEVLESIHKDMQGLNQEMDTISRLIGAVLNQRNCSINELLPEHHWKLDGKCKDDVDTDNRVCSESCPTLFLDPETKKSPVGRTMAQLRLEPTDHRGICAILVDGSSSSFVDLGDWAGSCISQPERCSSGLSITAWLKLNLNRDSNVAYILTSGDFDTRSRGFVILARHQEELGRNNIGVTVLLRDATYFWSAVATVPTRRWCHFGFSWSRTGDLDVFIDGQRITKNAIVIQDHSLPSPMTRLTIGNPPSIDTFSGSFAISDLRVYLVRLEERDMLELYRRDSIV